MMFELWTYPKNQRWKQHLVFKGSYEEVLVVGRSWKRKGWEVEIVEVK